MIFHDNTPPLPFPQTLQGTWVCVADLSVICTLSGDSMPPIWKDGFVVCHHRACRQMAEGPQVPRQPLLRKSSPGSICSIVFQEPVSGLPIGLPGAWEHSPSPPPQRHCLCSFPSLALSRTNVAVSPSIKHTIRREGIHFTITQANTHLQSVPNFEFCTVTIWPLGKKKTKQVRLDTAPPLLETSQGLCPCS